MSLKEYFLLSGAQAAAKRVPEDARARIARTLGVARRRAEAAERLWANGHTAEGLRLAVEAYGLTREALPAFADASGARKEPGEGTAAFRPVLAERGLSKGRIDGLLDVEAALRERALPSLDADVEAADGELFHRVIQARAAIDGALAPAASTPSALAWTRAFRIGLTVLVLAGAAVGTWLLTRRPEGVTAVASDYTNVYDGSLTVDGDEATEWQLPDRTLGHVTITIEPPVRVETLRLLNGHNRWYNDRAVRGYRVELYVGGSVARAIDGEFETFEEQPGWVEHPVGLDRVEQIRFNVRSHHRIGAALAEIEWR
ncbi:MAG: hypothetical protein KF729_18100 [Sandaracinaceae bacterium]|nr:hypothetical protein [Sandaracinaceae bacterium]